MCLIVETYVSLIEEESDSSAKNVTHLHLSKVSINTARKYMRMFDVSGVEGIISYLPDPQSSFLLLHYNRKV